LKGKGINPEAGDVCDSYLMRYVARGVKFSDLNASEIDDSYGRVI
jgi:hypothetical protein